MFYIKTHTFVSKANLHVLRQNQKFCKENVITRAKKVGLLRLKYKIESHYTTGTVSVSSDFRLQKERKTGLEPATFGLGSQRSTS